MTTKKQTDQKKKAPAEDTEVLLPTSPEGLDTFVELITDKYNLPRGDDTYDAIATMIMHIPAQRAYAPLAYFGNGVLKSMANAAAYQRLREIAQRREEKKKAEQEKLTAPTTPALDVQEPVDGEPL